MTRLGRACVSNIDCATATETGLTCVTETSNVLGDGAPPKGLCTRSCATDDDCAAHGAGALCFPFADGASYCIEGCRFGTPDIGDTKCHSRPEFACNPALFGSTGDPCQSSQDCLDGELCLEGTCNVVSSGCLPACRGDIDCGAGRYCDQSFLSGVCMTQKPIGKRLGEPCIVPAPGQPNEPDQCLGFCQADTANGIKGHCATSCAFARQCGWDAETRRFDGLCAFGSVLTPADIAEGDFGFCALACNCSKQCNDATLECQLLSDQALPADSFSGAGLCFQSDLGSTPLEACGANEAGGAGGAGGAP